MVGFGGPAGCGRAGLTAGGVRVCYKQGVRARAAQPGERGVSGAAGRVFGAVGV